MLEMPSVSDIVFCRSVVSTNFQCMCTFRLIWLVQQISCSFMSWLKTLIVTVLKIDVITYEAHIWAHIHTYNALSS